MTDSIQIVPNPEDATSNVIEQVFLNNYDLVYRTAYRMTGSATDAEDVLQTLFVRLVRKAPVEVHSGWPVYLRRAAVNISLDVLRKRARGVSLGDMEPWIESSDPDPHRRHESVELGDRLRAALAGINPNSAEMFVLRHVEGYSNKEIATMLGTSSGSVAVTVFRARSLLRKSLQSFRGGR